MNKEIYLAGGCFWGAQHYFKQIEGVLGTETGFANGNTENPTYKEVYTDTTGYAETVHVCYDPSKVTLEFLLGAFFCAIDPVSVNKQGEDCGTRYRTGIYYVDEEDMPVIRKVFEEQQAQFDEPLAVEVEPLRNFTAADEYHQDYLDKKPDGYCHLPLKIFKYPRICNEASLILSAEDDAISTYANAAAILKERLHNFFWVGFYLVKDGQLVLGPFQGPSACTRIGYGKGVCGTSWKEDKTLVVPDVEEFPGHIACSSLSRSEIVVPLRKDAEVIGVLDIDSTELSDFDRIDRFWLEEYCRILQSSL